MKRRASLAALAVLAAAALALVSGSAGAARQLRIGVVFDNTRVNDPSSTSRTSVWNGLFESSA